jgi:uncharacterized RDD family membrane protein YckC
MVATAASVKLGPTGLWSADPGPTAAGSGQRLAPDRRPDPGRAAGRFVMGFLRGALALAGGLAFNLILLVAIALYETVLLVSGGQTLGKMLFGLRVVRVDRAPLTPRDVASAGCQR